MCWYANMPVIQNLLSMCATFTQMSSLWVRWVFLEITGEIWPIGTNSDSQRWEKNTSRISRLLHKGPKLQKIVARTEVRSCWRIQFTHPVELQCLEFRGCGHRVTFEPPCMFFFRTPRGEIYLRHVDAKSDQKHGNDFASDFRVFLRRSEVTTKICRSGEKRELLPALQILKPLQHVRFPHFKGFLIPILSLFQWFFYFCSHCEVKDLPEHFKCFFASTEARAMERVFVFQPFEGKQQISKRSLHFTSFTSFWNKDALETEWTNPKSKCIEILGG